MKDDLSFEDRMRGYLDNLTSEQRERDLVAFYRTIDAWQRKAFDENLRTFYDGIFTISHAELDRWSGLTTKHGMHQVCLRFGLDFCDCHCALMACDIVGPDGLRKIENYRTAGVLFRYIDTHADRLAEFQSRLDAAKRRTERGREEKAFA